MRSDSTLASFLIAALAGNFGGILPPAPLSSLVSAAPRRGRSRTPFGNCRRFYGGARVNIDTNTVAGIPGSKLARKAAEGRIGRQGGRALSAASRVLCAR